MRVAYLVSQYPAPTHTFIRREIHALRERGIDVHTFGVRPPKAAERLSPVDHAEYENTFYLLPASLPKVLSIHLTTLFTRPTRYFQTLKRAFDHRVPGARAVLWAVFYFTEALILARELERRSIERLHNHFANAGAIVGYLASAFLRIPFSLTLHGMSEFEYPGGFLLREKIEAADFVACVSHFGRAQAFKATRAADWPKMTIVRCGVELDLLVPAPKPHSDAPARIVCVGRLSPEKGQLGLLEAFAAVIASGTRAELRLVGDGPDRAEVEAQIRQRKLGGHCVVAGWKSEAEVLEEIARADMLVMASFMEGLPVVLMEALGLGIPVIAPCVAGIPELVRDGETGLLFSPGHWAELSECLRMLCSDRALRARLGARGRVYVEQEFDVRRAIEPLVQHFSGHRVDAPPVHRPRLSSPRAPESSALPP